MTDKPTLWVECPRCDGSGWEDGCEHGAFSVVSHVADCGSRKVWPCRPFAEASPADLVGVVRHLPNVEEMEWCAEHGDMSAGLYGFRLDAYSCWAFTQIDWSLYPDATDCDFIDVAVVPLGGDDT